ncbi:PAB-dependent poly(A)-specific ribonuclease-like protein subunit pan2 [Lepidopterella palustris CBS 459.81]|uniref:PAN2-PAN3 deadenylation complex catalytic subunit PAN2 n=1 Tax=Lepidopterella palustris CBS 459.81 TaxID=1314670 RepID=A0A8E2DZ33_9PEZI|nr:PAB-dependent poly(A)-specific ribonuclease-like protein subunit pan2 [Lepidopterella palustris CBS 459.81]
MAIASPARLYFDKGESSAYYEKVAIIQLPPPGPHQGPTPVTTFAFDTIQELLWTGNDFGRITSFYGPNLEKYTSYIGHPQAEGAVKQLLFTEKGVLSISKRSIHFSIRRGLTQWHLTNDAFKDLRCMNFTSKGTREVLIAGCQDEMFKVDVDKGVLVETIPAEANYTIMKRAGQYICAATDKGAVHVLDSGNLKLVIAFQPHKGTINDMDAKGDFVVTCGWSPRQQFGFMLDPFTNAFSLKTMSLVPPIPFHTGAAFVRMHPKMSTTCVIISQNGQMQVIDVMNPDGATLRQVNLYDAFISGFEMAPSGEAFALSNTSCNIHLWGSPTKIHFPEYSDPTEFADHLVPPPSMDWSLGTPLSTVGIPFYKEVLLSGWPNHMVFEVGAPPPKIDPTILNNMTRTEIGFYAKNPTTKRRNQVEDTRLADRTNDSLTAPKFLSEKARAAQSANDIEAKALETMETLTDLHLDDVTRKDVPAMYGNVEIKYSKFGVDDFDFAYYNQTPFSGLETHIANSYANPLLQLCRFTPLIRNFALHHTASSCLYEACLLCELGFLIDMLEKAGGLNCQASNFLKTFSSLSNVASLGLLEELSPNVALTSMIQSFNRFLLDKIAEEFRRMMPQQNLPSIMDQVLETQALASMRCASCGNETVKGGKTFVNDLAYPAKTVVKNPLRAPRPTFSQILKASVERQDQTRGWCTKCNRYQQMVQRKTIQQIPAVLMINAAIQSHEAKQLWSTPNWLPQEIGIIVEQGQFFCYEGQDLKLHLQRGVYNIIVYELIGVVADINSGEHQKPHLVSMINTSPSSPDATSENKWFLFNDFLVRSIPKEEALRFEPTWKLPAVLTFQAKAAGHQIDDTWKQHLDTQILYRWWSANPEPPESEFKLLNPETEVPHAGYPVAIDAEFIRLQSEEIEMKADGTRETIRPDRKGLARVSVCRGAGELAGLPFIDDYIAVSEPVVDYLTAWSGIEPGDLDRATSPHALVGLKHAYKKLWLLLNLGCVFVGHSLANDFRTINIHVPKKQVVDTVDLFFKPSLHRKLNLKFLAWCVLKEKIQQDTHDSIEDATTALKLWRKFEEFNDAGVLEQMLNDIYTTGREVGFRAPGSKELVKGNASGSGGGGGRDTPEPGRSDTPGVGSTPKKGGIVAFGRGVGFGSRSPMK